MWASIPKIDCTSWCPYLFFLRQGHPKTAKGMQNAVDNNNNNTWYDWRWFCLLECMYVMFVLYVWAPARSRSIRFRVTDHHHQHHPLWRWVESSASCMAQAASSDRLVTIMIATISATANWRGCGNGCVCVSVCVLSVCLGTYYDAICYSTFVTSSTLRFFWNALKKLRNNCENVLKDATLAIFSHIFNA